MKRITQELIEKIRKQAECLRSGDKVNLVSVADHLDILLDDLIEARETIHQFNMTDMDRRPIP
jgi:hypothetical protein